MSGPQFIHLQTFSRKPNPAGQSVAQILGEVLRTPEFSHHVDAPAPPELVDGISPSELVARHDAMVENAKVVVKVKGKTHHRAIRKDRHTLMTAVVSYPIPRDQIEGNPEEEAALRRWEARNVAFFKKLFGDQYQATYRHTDEPYPHLHVYALPEMTPGVDATQIHPGKLAKSKAEVKSRAKGATPREAVAAGNRALKTTMRKFQDVYYLHVGEPCGLLRIGPRRQRLSRKDYQAQKHAARLRSTSVLETRSSELESREGAVAAARDEMSREKRYLARVKADLKTRQQDLTSSEARIAKVVNSAASSLKQLHRLVSDLGDVLGLGRFGSIREGLAGLEGAVASLQAEAKASPEADEDPDQSPSW